jgi:hypothetical protein
MRDGEEVLIRDLKKVVELLVEELGDKVRWKDGYVHLSRELRARAKTVLEEIREYQAAQCPGAPNFERDP